MSITMLLFDKIFTGLELEYEGVSPDASAEALVEYDSQAAQLWSCELDGSLRPRGRNTEFKFASPLRGESVLLALDAVCHVLQHNTAYTASWRCGMHVHVDNSKRPQRSAEKQAVLACLMDRIWFGWDNTGRYESKFCTPIAHIWPHMLRPRDVHQIRLQIALRPANRAAMANFTPPPLFRTFKYTGLNITRAHSEDINTVEYRYPACTMDKQVMLDFINLATWAADFANQFETCEEIVRTFVRADTFYEWINKYGHELIKPLLIGGVDRIKGTVYPTPLEIEAALALAYRSDSTPLIES